MQSKPPCALIAADLDNTLIFSAAALARHGNASPIVCVETKDGAEMSYMTVAAADTLIALAQCATVMPVTTRSPEQLSRVTLPGPASDYAIAANGGILFADGEVDRAWSAHVAHALGQVTSFGQVHTHLQNVCRPEWTISFRAVEALFCYAVIDRSVIPLDFVAETTEWADGHGWSVSLQGRKLYWVPKTLTKAAAMGEVARRVDASLILAAGDSLLDIDMLQAADRGVFPAHGEIADSGWSAGHVAALQTLGVAAGEEICRWFLTQVQLQPQSV